MTQPQDKAAASPAMATAAPTQEKEAEAGEGEMEETPVKITAKSVKRTLHRSKSGGGRQRT